LKKHIDMTNVVGMLLFALALTYFAWGKPDPRGLVLFCVFTTLSETFVHLRWRMSVACSLCGFDPVIYKRSPAQASAKVKEFFETNRNDPEFWLTRSPLVELQKKIRVQERRKTARQDLREQMQRRAKAVAPTKTL
jgi:hypothetical protein